MEKVTSTILDYLWDKNDIPEELLYEFAKKTIKTIQTRCTERLTGEFWELERYVESFWRAKRFEGVSSTHIYEMGRLLSITSMLSMVAEQEEKSQSLEVYATKLQDWYLVFKGMHDKPGISHGELAEVCRKSVSSLSQFICKYEWDGLYIYRRSGRGKNYYLTEQGKQLYELMTSKQPRPREEKGVDLIVTKNSIDKALNMLVNDSQYKVVKTESDEYLESKIYRIDNSKADGRRAEAIGDIRFSKKAFGMKKGENEICQKSLFLKKQNVI